MCGNQRSLSLKHRTKVFGTVRERLQACVREVRERRDLRHTSSKLVVFGSPGWTFLEPPSSMVFWGRRALDLTLGLFFNSAD